jgi:hypothetical protein
MFYRRACTRSQGSMYRILTPPPSLHELKLFISKVQLSILVLFCSNVSLFIFPPACGTDALFCISCATHYVSNELSVSSDSFVLLYYSETLFSIRWWRVFIPSTQRHYGRLILLLKLLHVSVVRPSWGRNVLARITQLTTDPFLQYS